MWKIFFYIRGEADVAYVDATNELEAIEEAWRRYKIVPWKICKVR
jgi:hypothetical protein